MAADRLNLRIGNNNEVDDGFDINDYRYRRFVLPIDLLLLR